MVNKIYDEYTDRKDLSYGLKHYYRNREKRLEVKRNFKIRSPEMYILNGTRSRAKDRGMDFNLELEDILIPEICPICQIPLKFSDKRTDSTPSVDRLDNLVGYLKGNIRIISWRANRIKNDLTKSEILRMAEYIQGNI